MSSAIVSPLSSPPTNKPKFGGGGEKCKTCSKAVYPQEKIAYDNGVWHQMCFKCLSCRSTLSLTAVAMISGDLYCRTCFKKIFLKEGKYSTFDANRKKEDKTGGESVTSPAPSPSPPPSASPPTQHGTLDDSSSVHSSHSGNTSNSDTSKSSSQPLSVSSIVPEKEKEHPIPARSPSPSITAQAAISPASSPSTRSASSSVVRTPIADLQEYIEHKDWNGIEQLVNKHGVTLLLQTLKPPQVNALEYCLGHYLYKGIGVKMVQIITQKIEQTNQLLEQHHIQSPFNGQTVAGDTHTSHTHTEPPATTTDAAAVADSTSTSTTAEQSRANNSDSAETSVDTGNKVEEPAGVTAVTTNAE